MKIEKTLYPNHSFGCNITGPSNSGISVILTNLILNFTNEYDKIYIYSPSFHRNFYQKLKKCFSKYIPFQTMPKILNEKNIDKVIDEIVNNEQLEKFDNEMETNESIEEL